MFAVAIIALTLGALVLVLPIVTLTVVLRIEKEQRSNHTNLDGRLSSIERRLLNVLGRSSGVGAKEGVSMKEKGKAVGPDLDVAKAAISEVQEQQKPDPVVEAMRFRAEVAATAQRAASMGQKSGVTESPKQPTTMQPAKELGLKADSEKEDAAKEDTAKEVVADKPLADSLKLDPEKKAIQFAKVVGVEKDDKEKTEEYALKKEPSSPSFGRTDSEARPSEARPSAAAAWQAPRQPLPTYSQSMSYEPSALEIRTKEVLGKIWNWIIVGEEHRSKDVSMEFAIATNWLVRISVLMILFGIGFFLKYSVDQGWLNATGRVVLASLAGIGMVAGGLFALGGKKYDLFGQGLVGAGVATLYGTIFAAMKFEGMIQQLPAFVLMSLVTALSCGIAIRFNKLLIAMIGTIGGYATPLMLHTGVPNLPGLFSYLTILTAGVLAISYAKDWHLVRAVSFFGAWGLIIASLASVWSDRAFEFAVVMPFMVGFFVMFSTMNFIYNLFKRKEATLLELGMLWGNAAIFFFIAYKLIDVTFDSGSAFCCKQFAFVTLGMAAFYVAHIYYFLVKKIEDRVLLSSFFAIASLMLTITVPILLSREWLSMTWAIQALVMLWVAQKLDSRFLEAVAGVLYVMVFCMFVTDLGHHFQPNHMADALAAGYWNALFDRLITFGTMIGSFFGASWLLNHKRKRIESLCVQDASNWGMPMEQNSLAAVMSVLCVGLGFLYLNIEFYKTFNYVDKMLTAPALTVLWVGLSAFLLVQYLRNGDKELLTIFTVAVAGLLAKLLFFDLVGWEVSQHFYYPVCEFKGGLIRLFDFGVIIAGLAVVGRLLWDSDEEKAHQLSVVSIVGSIVLLFGYTSLELSSTLYHLLPGSRAGGVSVLWSLYALAFIAIGIWKNVRALRYAGLALFAIVSLKVFFVDLANVEKVYRIIAFILLGIILMCGSLVYMRCRQAFHLKDDEEESERITEEVTD